MPHRLTDVENQPGGEVFEGPTPPIVGSDPSIVGEIFGKLAGGGGRAAGLGAIASIPVVGPFIAGGLGAVDIISGLIPRANKGRIKAAVLQQNIEKVAVDIEQRVANGTLDPDAALHTLQQLQLFTQQLAATPDDADLQRAGQMANLIITQVSGNISSQRTRTLAQPFRNRFSTEQGIEDTRGTFGTPTFQKERLATGLRDFFTGTPGGIGESLRSEGGPQGEDPSFTEILTKRFQPTERLGEFTGQVNEQFPTGLANPEEFSNIGQTFQDIIARNRQRRV